MTAFAFVIGVVVLVIGLAVSIALHELGHLVPAKLFGVRVGQYMIGFGPTLWSRRFGETEYGVKAIPLGGYISMAGMYPPSPKERERAAQAGRTGRAGGGFFATMVQDARTANDETLEGADDARTFYRLPVWKRVVVMLGGPFMNLVFAIVLLTILFSGIGVQTATATVSSVSACVPSSTSATTCAAGDPAAPAQTAGIQPGDRIVSIDGQAVSTFTDVSAIIQRSAGQQLALVVERNGAQQTIVVTPAARTTGGQQVGFLGVTPTSAYVPQPIWSGAGAAFQNVGAVTGVIVRLPGLLYETATSLFTGAPRDPNGPLSLVGAGAIAGEVATSDVPVLNRVGGMLGLLASLNIALFVFNLVPLLPLDGGHVVIALWDGIKRTWAKIFRRPPPKPIDATKLVPVTFVVVVVLIAMGALLALADIVNPVNVFG
ncbi:M50 family metallopeptidase [Microbacterium sp. X-17]|uniref:M50 family metallopeptidase n=1 Tax=Microbacterium sp. X-17 TaxID=3144404 RepID=UPI0031F4D58C